MLPFERDDNTPSLNDDLSRKQKKIEEKFLYYLTYNHTHSTLAFKRTNLVEHKKNKIR